MVCTNPGSSGNHGHNSDDDAEHTPREDRSGSVVDGTVLECADDGVDEPCDTGGGTSRVNTAEMLEETSQEDADGKRSPLCQTRCVSVVVGNMREQQMRNVGHVPFGRRAQEASRGSNE